MARDDLLKRYQEAGTEFIESTVARAEEFFREVARIGENTQKQAQDRVEDLREGSRRSTDQLIDTIRRELGHQVAQFSFATRSDLARIEARLDALERGRPGAAAAAPPAKKAPANKAPAKKAAATAAKSTSASKPAPAAKSAPASKAPPAKKAPADKAVKATQAPRAARVTKAAKAAKATKAPATADTARTSPGAPATGG
ncbi:MAG TPA: hypothetical protein VG184_09935 [Acidimicrobiales bacterium]|nr:hypothetical protein [Acidimicrobiales bacterium]